ncbi:MAG: hypothetical protein EOO46_15035 [Flavobacterium sp.]|nr:MAG: hypothetical protein EOO46_15035 [Flavobacterium sp.]
MRIHIKILVITIAFFSSFSSCVKDDCDENKIVSTHDLDANTYSQIMVYKDLDTVRFLKNGTDTVEFFAGKVNKKYQVDLADGGYGCGKEQYQIATQKFKNNANDSFEIQFSKFGFAKKTADKLDVIFNDIYFQVHFESIINCGNHTPVLGKSYCYEEMFPARDSRGKEPRGSEYIYYSKDFGIVKAFVNSNTYERLP